MIIFPFGAAWMAIQNSRKRLEEMTYESDKLHYGERMANRFRDNRNNIKLRAMVESTEGIKPDEAEDFFKALWWLALIFLFAAGFYYFVIA